MANDRFRVVVLDDYEQFCTRVPAYQKTRALADVKVVDRKLTTDQEWSEAIGAAHAVVLMRERSLFGEREFGLAPSLRFISQISKGMPHLDVAGATRRGIAVSATPSDSGISTVELTFALMLALARHVPAVNQGMHAGDWPPSVGIVLSGKTLGIIGLGRLGRQVAQIAQAFGMNVLASGKTLTEERANAVGARRVSLETLLKESDVVSLHCRSNAETKGLIDAKAFASMKPGALLINTARGPIVSERALIASLEKGHLGGVGLDVYDVEPLPVNHPFRKLDNAILMSHRGYGVDEILHERYEHALTNVVNFINGEPTGVVNLEALAQ